MPSPTEAYKQRQVQTARNELILSHLSLVRHVLGKLIVNFPATVDVENLEAAGVLGLVDAANKFDPSKGIQFKTYAYIRIRGAVLDELRRNSPLPQHVLERVSKLREAEKSLPSSATIEEIAQQLGWTPEEVQECQAAQQVTHVTSLKDSEERLRADVSSPDQLAELTERKHLIAEAITLLPERERLVVTLYYLEDLRLREIGSVLSLSESRISRLLNGALEKIREYVLEKEGSS